MPISPPLTEQGVACLAEQSLVVVFDGTHRVSYDATELDQIVLGYAATVHKVGPSVGRSVGM